MQLQIISNNINTVKFVVSGASIRVENRSKVKTGIVVILPKVEVLIGSLLTSFMEALYVSRLPIALTKTMCKGNYTAYNIIRMATGNIPEAIIGALSIYDGIIIGVTFNKGLLNDKQFRQKVSLSAMHQIVICCKETNELMFTATKYISLLTGEDRESMIVTQTSKSIKVKIKYKSEYKLPIYYIFTLTKEGTYALSQVAYDTNDIVTKLNNKA